LKSLVGSLVSVVLSIATPAYADVQMTAYGAVGDGVTDDTAAVQTALTACSDASDRCVVPAGKTFAITDRLFLWGGASLYAVNKEDGLTFNGNGTNLVNIGISALLTPAAVWTGTISHMTFTVTGQPGDGGRILFFWRTNGGTVTDVVFNPQSYVYGPTSSGNNNTYLANCESNAYSDTNPCVRRNLTITYNTVDANSTAIGSEGFGLGWFDTAEIAHNTISTVGDDPIGMHFSRNLTIHDNVMSSVDGRLFLANVKDSRIYNNRATRVASFIDGWHAGVALLYVGFETTATNSYPAPTNITIVNNKFIYPVGSIDNGAAMYLYGIRSSYIARNRVYNYSATLGNTVGLHLLPRPMTGTWTDPDGIDPTTVGRVHSNVIQNNSFSSGTVALSMQMTGNCADHTGKLGLYNNVSSSSTFYCGYGNIGAYQSTSGDPAATRAVRN